MTLETKGRLTKETDLLPRSQGLIRLLRLAVVFFSVVTVIMYAGSIPGYYNELVSRCIVQGCGLWIPSMPLSNAMNIDLSLETYGVLFVLIDSLFTLLFYGAAFVIFWKGKREPMGLLAVLAMVAFGTSFPSLIWVASQESIWHQNWFMIVATLGWVSLSLLFLLFPNGSFVPKWTSFAFIFIAAFDATNLFYGGSIWTALDIPPYFQLLWYTSSTLILIYSQVYRFRKVSSPAQRQQTKWVVFGVSVGVVGFIVLSIMFDPNHNDGTALTYVFLNALLNMSLTAIPLTLTLAVLRHRLWDIDPLVKRTLVYLALSVSVIALYTFAVLYLSRLFQTKDNFVVSLLATAVVAVAFAPLKEWLQRFVNRLMKGRHDDPYAVLLELGSQLVQPLAPDAMLDAVAKTVKDALRLPYTGIAIGVGGQDTLVAAAGEPVNEIMPFSIIHRGKEIGTLHLASRSPGEAFSSEDLKFLDVLLHQAGPIVENVNMTLGMKLLAQDLQESREQLVLAREEERRQIRKNLHDGLAPKLAALALNAATAQKYVEKEPETAIEMLTDLRKVIRSTVDEIRTMVHDLRPPTLDELGLINAIQERIEELTKPARLLADQGTAALHVKLLAPQPLPELPAAVEVAAYRIVTESLVNVIKHAEATSCTVRLDITPSSQLIAEVTDNGSGLHPRPHLQQASNKGGIGLVSIKERAAELGGQCTIERMEQGGTRVLAIIPL